MKEPCSAPKTKGWAAASMRICSAYARHSTTSRIWTPAGLVTSKARGNQITRERKSKLADRHRDVHSFGAHHAIPHRPTVRPPVDPERYIGALDREPL